jgi:peptidoglycan hydrolase CwlO-like protein
LKNNIQPLSGSLDKILQLQGVSFNWKDNNRSSIGLIAQDVEKIYPELVSTNSQTDLKSIEYGNLVAPLIESVKEQQGKINKLESLISSQQKEIEQLKQQIGISK